MPSPLWCHVDAKSALRYVTCKGCFFPFTKRKEGPSHSWFTKFNDVEFHFKHSYQNWTRSRTTWFTSSRYSWVRGTWSELSRVELKWADMRRDELRWDRFDWTELSWFNISWETHSWAARKHKWDLFYVPTRSWKENTEPPIFQTMFQW